MKDQTRTSCVPLETHMAVKRAVLLRLGTGRNLVLILVIFSVITSLGSFFYPEKERNSLFSKYCYLFMEVHAAKSWNTVTLPKDSQIPCCLS
jgi:hypothetical protein